MDTSFQKQNLSSNILKIFVLDEHLIIKSAKDKKWICDVFAFEFINYINNNKTNIMIVNNPEDADIIWLLASWCYKRVNVEILKKKYVITTIHHIDLDKFNENKKMYDFLDSITNKYHTISEIGCDSIMKFTTHEIITCNFWINENIFFEIQDKISLKRKYNIPDNKFIIGSFQRDSEGSDTSKPKLSKGPDILAKILDDMNKEKEIFIILTGWRRNYIVNELTKLKINFIYLEMVEDIVLNELYNCLDLYIVSSRVEGGPRAILECALTKTPIISTNVGIASLILNNKSIFDMNNYLSYKDAVPNIKTANKNGRRYMIKKYMKTFINHLFLS